MAFEALRFIHATAVMADHQVRDIGPCDRGVRSELINATLTALDRIIEACVEHEVDFLLLTGDTFCEAERSLRARVALRKGFECLRDAGIDVFVVPGPNDPPAAWEAVPDLPDNVSVFNPETDEPTAVMRNGNVLATLQGCLPRTDSAHIRRDDSSSLGQSRIGPFRIGIIPPFVSSAAVPDESTVETWLSRHRVDYLALPCPFSRVSVTRMEQIAHCPGPATPMSRSDLGPFGCSLVTVEGRSRVSTELIVASPLQRETIRISSSPSASWDELIAAMRRYVECLPALERTTVLSLDWQLSGSGDLFESLKDEDAEKELFELLEADASLGDSLHLLHRLTLTPAAESDSRAEVHHQDEAHHEGTAHHQDEAHHEGEQRHDEAHHGNEEPPQDAAHHEEETADDPIRSDFLERLDQEPSLVGSVMRRLDRGGDESASPWLRRLKTLAERVSEKNVADSGRDHAREWFERDEDS